MNKKIATILLFMCLAVLLSGCHGDESLNHILETGEYEQESIELAESASQIVRSESESETEKNTPEIKGDTNGRSLYDMWIGNDTIEGQGKIIYESINMNEDFLPICKDPLCQHLVYDEKTNTNPSCSAAIHSYHRFGQFESVCYNNYRYIFEVSEEISRDDSVKYHTTVFRSNMDGSERRDVARFDGMWLDLNMASVQDDHILYMPILVSLESESEYIGVDEMGIPVYECTEYYQYSYISLDLLSLKITELMSESYESDSFYGYAAITEHSIYVMQKEDEKAWLYVISRESQEVRKITLENALYTMCGGCGSLLYLIRESENGNKELIAYNDLDDKIESSINISSCQSACIINDQIAICDVYEHHENQAGKTEYKLLNQSYEVTRELVIDGCIRILFSSGDNLFYEITPCQDDDPIYGVYVVDIHEIDQLMTKGVYVGPGFTFVDR